MGMRNLVIPNLNLPKINNAPNSGGSWRGWCLKYVDDAVNAPARKGRAKWSYEQEVKNGNIRGDIAVGVWAPGYLGFTTGAYKEYGHVFWAKKNADGTMEIHDSETHYGRAPYRSIAELLAWFGAYNPKFLGYTMGIDGIHIVEEFPDPVPEPPKPAPQPTPQPAPKPQGIKVGDTVVPTRLVSYDNVPLKQWDDNYKVIELIGDRAVLEARGQVWAAMRLSDIRKA